jgi:energy-coupling factor transporter ATP-binding protein EcfA2
LQGWGFRHYGRSAPTLSGVDLDIRAGERVLLLGASGAGKSTLLRAIAGLIDDAGAAVGELLVEGDSPRAGAGPCAYVAQDPTAGLVMTRAGDDVAFGLENVGAEPGSIWPRVDAALSGVGLAGFGSRDTTRLSGGEQQRLVLAGAMAMRPRILLLDEPTALLDPDGAAEVRSTVTRLADENAMTVVLVEHRIDQWAGMLDRVVVVAAGGGVITDGPPERVFADDAAALARMGVWTPGGAVIPPRRGRISTGPAVVRAADVSLRYPDAAADAVSSSSVDLHAGRLLAVTGPNGAGKSSLGRMLAGLVRPTSGAVYARSSAKPLHRWRSADLARTVGMVFQNPEHQFVATTVAGELAVGQRVAGVDPAARARRVDDLLERLRLTDLASADPFTLSGGEQRRLSVATALAAAPAAVVLDEPTYGQDRATWTELVDLLDEVRVDGTALCCISHDEALVEALADDVLRLSPPLPPREAGPAG